MPDATLKRLAWREKGGSIHLVRRTGRPPTSLVHLQCNVESNLELPDLPPFLQHLDLCHSRLPPGDFPALSATLRHLDVGSSDLTQHPAYLPLQLIHLHCSINSLTALPALPKTLKFLRLRIQSPDRATSSPS